MTTILVYGPLRRLSGASSGKGVGVLSLDRHPLMDPLADLISAPNREGRQNNNPPKHKKVA